jgi:peptidyl-prolyl cis-trans isomerase SurA
MRVRPLLLVLFFWLFFWAKTPKAEVVNKIVAVVGSEVLTLYELEKLAQPLYQQFLTQNLPLEEKERLKAQIRKEVLERWIEDTVIGLEAKKHKITVSDEEFNRFYQAEVKRLGGEERLKEELAKEGKTVEEYKKNLREQLTKIKFVQIMVGSKIAIPEEELKKLYQERIKNFDPSPKYELEVLIVRDEGLISEVEDLLKRGEGLGGIASRYSEKIFYVKETFKEEELDKELLSLLKDMNPGSYTPPLKRGNVHHIVKLVKKLAGEPPKFEEMRDSLYEELFNQRAKEYLERWIKELKETRFVKIYL